MKINLEIDCTPEEARRAMGLPDLTPVHAQYLQRLAELMEGRIQPEAVEAMMRSWAPVGDASLGFWRTMFERTGSNDG